MSGANAVMMNAVMNTAAAGEHHYLPLSFFRYKCIAGMVKKDKMRQSQKKMYSLHFKFLSQLFCFS